MAMEIKVYTIELDAPRWVKRAIVLGVLPVGALLGAALVARAGVSLTTFTPNTKISAKEVNDNFTALGNAVAGLAPANTVPKITAWQTYTPALTTDTGSVIGNQTTIGVYRRIGDSIEVSISTRFSGSPPSGVSYFRWSLPPQLTIDQGRTVGGNSPLLGSGAASEGLIFHTLSTHAAPTGGVIAAANDGFLVNDKVPVTFNTGTIALHFTAPVTGWTVTTP
jgi:hypothetical protein